MKRLSPRLLLLLALAAPLVFLNRPAGAARRIQATPWASVRTRNFLVEGGAGEEELRRVAATLEAYRAAFARLFPGEYFDANVPTAVVIFPDDASYTPFKPRFGGHV